MFSEQRVNIQSIEQELTRLWKNIAEAAKEGQLVVRTCLLNLIVVAQTQEEADLASRVIAEMTAQHPCRAIVLFLDCDASEETLDAWVTAHCQLPFGKAKQVCCEQIFVRTGSRQLPGLVAPLLVADLPVFLWWMGKLPQPTPLLTRLEELADRWVIDSAHFGTTLPAFLLHLLGSSSVALSDINWSRLTTWRELIAQFFDPLHLRPLLSQIRTVRITWADSWQARLLMGWLASRLGWEYQGRQDTEYRFLRPEGADKTTRADERRIAVALESGSAGFLHEIELVTPGARFEARKIHEDLVLTRTLLDGHDPLERHVRLPKFDLAQYVCGELEILTRDKVYEEAVSVLYSQ